VAAGKRRVTTNRNVRRRLSGIKGRESSAFRVEPKSCESTFSESATMASCARRRISARNSGTVTEVTSFVFEQRATLAAATGSAESAKSCTIPRGIVSVRRSASAYSKIKVFHILQANCIGSQLAHKRIVLLPLRTDREVFVRTNNPTVLRTDVRTLINALLLILDRNQ
jgi:hypothetical protein